MPTTVKLVGGAPNQVPRNKDLGNLAYQNAENIAGPVSIGGSLTVAGSTILNNATAKSVAVSSASADQFVTKGTIPASSALFSGGSTNLLTYSELFNNAAWTKSNAFVQTNLLLQSQTLNTAPWGGNNASITSLTSLAPDNTSTGNVLLPNTVFGVHTAAQSVTIGAGPHTVSAYVKANGYNKVGIREDALSGAAIAVDLSNGNVLTTAGLATFSVTAAGNGYWRISMTYGAGGGNAAYVLYVLPDSYTSGTFFNVNWTPNGTSGLLVWGTQLVQGAVAGDYKATTTAALPIGYTDAYGQLNAQKLVETTPNNAHYINLSTGTVSNIETLTFYAKAGERTWCAAQLGSNGVAYYDLQNGTVGTLATGSTATIISVGNGWYRCSLTATRTGNLNNFIYVASANNTASYAGDGTSGIYIFGAQLVTGNAVQPYLKTVETAVTAPYAAPLESPNGLALPLLSAMTPVRNNDMTFQLTSNTSLVVKVKGSDGVVRSATLTLA